MTKKKDNAEGVNNNFSKTKGDFIMSCVDLFAIKYETFEDSKFDKEQLEMLKMSEEDYNEGRIVSHESLDQSDLEWLKGK
jgi:hypothetical protein